MSATKIYLGEKAQGSFAITELTFTNKRTKNVVTQAYLLWVDGDNPQDVANEGNEMMQTLTRDQGELECTDVKFSQLAMPERVIAKLAQEMADAMRGQDVDIKDMTSINEGHPA